MAIQFRQQNCIIEYSEDNGNTWHVAADISLCSRPTLSGQPGEELRCSIASYLAIALEEMQDEVITGLISGANTVQILGAVSGVLGALIGGPVGAAVGVAVVELLAVAAQIDATNYSNAVNSNFYEYAKCQLFCILPDEGSITTTAINTWAESIRAYSGSASSVMNAVADYVNNIPLETWQNLAAMGSIVNEGNCELCECPDDCILIADTTNGTPTPHWDSVDPTLWTLTSTSTPNENGYYVVRYHLPYPDSCCRFEIPDDITGFYAPEHSTGVPFAGFRGCDEVEGYDPEYIYDLLPLRGRLKIPVR